MKRTMNVGLLALATVGAYYAWQNRFRIQKFLESQGIDTALDTSSITNTVRSGFAKLTGSADKIVNDASSALRDDDLSINQADRGVRRAI